MHLGRHIGRGIDAFLRDSWDVDDKSALDLVEDLSIFLRGDEGESQTLGTESTGTTDPVQVSVCAFGHVIVDNDVDTLNINTSSNQVSGHHDAGVEVLKFLVHLNSKNHEEC